MKVHFPEIEKAIEEHRGGAVSRRNIDFEHIELSTRHPNEEFELESLYKILELKENVRDGDVNRGIINM